MPVDWTLAARVGGLGFGLVFILFVILSLVVRLMGWLFLRFGTRSPGTGTKKNAA